MEKFLKDIIVKAGLVTLKYFGPVFKNPQFKANPLDVLTKADLASNELIIRAIKKQFPTHGIISEETGEENHKSKYVWVIDPIDGTLNFSRGIPLFMVMISLLVDNQVEMAAMYDPVHKDLFFARKNKGAFQNGKRIRCSAKTTLDHSVGSFNSRHTAKNLKIINKLVKFFPENKVATRGLWSAAVISSYTAAGRQDWLVSNGGKFWDYIGPSLILRESGCIVTNYKGQPWKHTDQEMVAANPKLHKLLIQALNT